MAPATTLEERVPVTPEVITWARVRAGYSLEDAAKHFKKIAEWIDTALGESPDLAAIRAKTTALASQFPIEPK